MPRRLAEVVPLVAGLAALAATIAAYRLWLDVSNPTTVALTFMLIVLLVASSAHRWTAIILSLVAMLCFNFFFLPPVGTWTIADPQNWVALVAFLAVSLIGSSLSAAVRDRAREAQTRRDELIRLFDLSRDILVLTDRQPMPVLARSIATRFALGYVAIALPDGGEWQVFESGALHVSLDHAQLTQVFARATGTLEFDARARTYGGHATQMAGLEAVRIVPLRMGTKAVGLLASSGRTIEPGTLDVLAGVVAIAIERARFLEERRTAETTRQSEELKTALLASLGHDLRTPLTAIRVAATNLIEDRLAATDRRDQADVILAEVERLTRLFQNILAMARIDAGPIATNVEWALPSEIIGAAREQVEQTLRPYKLEISMDRDEPVRLDPRLTATALAHVLENAAQYSSSGSVVRVVGAISNEELHLAVVDTGPGIALADLPRLFDRFYRGAAAAARASGTGMGLAIARGLLAAEGGRIWAENRPGGGAVFTIAVPIELKPPLEGV